MKIYKTIQVFCLISTIFLFSSCTDYLQVENTNNPDTATALQNINDIEALVGNQYQQWWTGVQSRPFNDRISLLGLESTNGYSFVRDFFRIPATAYENTPTYQWKAVVTAPWSNLYTAISSVNDGLLATDVRGLGFDDDSRTQRLRSFAKFVQGISYMALANHFDKAFILDENFDLTTDKLEFKPTEEVFNFGLQKLQEAREIASTNTFTLPNNWIIGNPLTSADFVKLMNSYEVRYTLQQCRTPECRDNLDWSRIKTLVESGLGELNINSNSNVWGESPGILQGTIFRTNYYLIGHTDISGKFEEWKNAAPEMRSEFVLETPDKRIAGQQDVTVIDGEGQTVVLEAGKRAPGTDFRWRGPSPWPATNGGWYGSLYMPIRTESIWLNGGIGEINHIRAAEMDMYLTEALLRASDPAVDPAAIELINKTRVERGGLTPITTADTFNDVWNAMRYEFDIETTVSAAGLLYYHKRGLGNYRGLDYGGLVQGTPLQFPIPAEELDLLELPYYTFGGVGGTSSAP
ncbi:hypothetical protein [Arenibacter sp. S6351L]|uniref:hypothetical protein n=1 Tax=Arenibacter sp. S6351L TaxID=2926407 RepID=UPI001FF500AD|nr:hypothetical protein [Arenibacter sp. S6351L]MCK0136074.1 hypothetical protein [Arenibacter sp. S6351L]